MYQRKYIKWHLLDVFCNVTCHQFHGILFIRGRNSIYILCLYIFKWWLFLHNAENTPMSNMYCMWIFHQICQSFTIHVVVWQLTGKSCSTTAQLISEFFIWTIKSILSLTHFLYQYRRRKDKMYLENHMLCKIYLKHNFRV